MNKALSKYLTAECAEIAEVFMWFRGAKGKLRESTRQMSLRPQRPLR